jgi:hypothetical protein
MQQNTQETATEPKRAPFCFSADSDLMARVDQYSKRIYAHTGIKTSRSQMIGALIQRGLEASGAA